MPKVLLNRSGVVPLIRELVAGGVPEHVRVDREGEFRELAGAHDYFSRRRRRHRSAAFRHEQIRRLRIIASEFAERPKLGATDRLSGGEAVLQSRDMYQAGLQVDLLPAHGDEFRDSQSMAVGQENERPIARTMAAHLARRLQQLLNLRRR